MHSKIALSFSELEWKVIENALLAYTLKKYSTYIDTKDENVFRFANISEDLAKQIAKAVEEANADYWSVEA